MTGFFEKTYSFFDEFGGYDRYGDNGKLIENHFKITEEGYILRCAKKVYAVRYGGGKCKCCGIINPIVLSFHHRIRGDKIETISNIIRNNGPDCSRKALEKELDKCDVLCGVCHAEKHCIDNSVSKNELLRIVGGIDYCMDCGYKSDKDYISGLNFHHKEGTEKKFDISSVYSKCSNYPRFNKSIEEIKNELKKCVIVCKNCHILRHAHYGRFIRLYQEILEKSKEWSGKEYVKRSNRFEDKSSKRYDRGHKSDPLENPFREVCHDSPKDKIIEEYEDRMINL